MEEFYNDSVKLAQIREALRVLQETKFLEYIKSSVLISNAPYSSSDIVHREALSGAWTRGANHIFDMFHQITLPIKKRGMPEPTFKGE